MRLIVPPMLWPVIVLWPVIDDSLTEPLEMLNRYAIRAVGADTDLPSLGKEIP